MQELRALGMEMLRRAVAFMLGGVESHLAEGRGLRSDVLFN